MGSNLLRFFFVVVLVTMYILTPADASASPVHAGLDHFQTVSPTHQDFSSTPIPADFFAPGSDPFSGMVILGGVPLGTDSTADTAVKRLDSAKITPKFPSTDTIPIEIVALQLTSVQPITVTYNGGQNPEPWNVNVTLSPAPQPQGSMTITHTNRDGGTFDAFLPVVPLLTFTRVGDGTVQMLDLGRLGGVVGAGQALQFRASAVPWSHDTPRNADARGRFCPGCVMGVAQPFSHQALTAVHSVILASKR